MYNLIQGKLENVAYKIKGTIFILKRNIKITYQFYKTLKKYGYHEAKHIIEDYTTTKECIPKYRDMCKFLFDKKTNNKSDIELVKLSKLSDTMDADSLDFHNEMKRRFKERLNTPAYRKA